MLLIIGGIATVISWLVHQRFQFIMRTLSKVSTQSGMTGREIAERMLREYDIYDVRVVATRGVLTDHFNPKDKTIYLSEAVYHQRNVRSTAVAAHECGHAIQDVLGYEPLKFRSKIVPVINISSRIGPLAMAAGIGLLEITRIAGGIIFAIGLLLFAGSTIFSLITLSVEFDASKRALIWLDRSGLSSGREYELVKRGLKWAARTYLIAAITQLAYLIYYLFIFVRIRQR